MKKRCRSRRVPELSAVAVILLAGAASPGRAQDIVVPEVAPLRPAWAGSDVPDPLWMLMEAAVAEADETRMKEMLLAAEQMARDDIVGHEQDTARRFALAAALGLRADREGGRAKIRAASQLHRELEAVLALDAEHAGANYLMGRLHAGVRRMNTVTRWLATNLLGGEVLKDASWSRAESHLSFAEASAPDVPDYHLQLARLYMDTDRPELARGEVEHVLRLRAVTPMEREVRVEANALATELGAQRPAVRE